MQWSICLLLCLVGIAFAQPVLDGYDHSSDISTRIVLPDPLFIPDGTYAMVYWTVDPMEDVLNMGVVTNATGWFGVGFSPSGQMILDGVASDAIVFFHDGENMQITDFTLGGRYRPFTCEYGLAAVCQDIDKDDCASDVQLTNSSLDDGYMVAEFARPLAASDACDQEIPIDGTPIYFLAAHGSFIEGQRTFLNVDQHIASFVEESMQIVFAPAGEPTDLPTTSSSSSEATSDSIPTGNTDSASASDTPTEISSSSSNEESSSVGSILIASLSSVGCILFAFFF